MAYQIDKGKALPIPIVEKAEKESRVAGGFCRSLDALTDAELAALNQLRDLRKKATAIKKEIKTTDSDEQRLRLFAELQALRQEADYWRRQRVLATEEKHYRLGHAVMPIK
ncbi:hypothetical protein ACQZV8_03710 [Magnetococcales bacterium HHB-1]